MGPARASQKKHGLAITAGPAAGPSPAGDPTIGHVLQFFIIKGSSSVEGMLEWCA
jgi:hypothetical protein